MLNSDAGAFYEQERSDISRPGGSMDRRRCRLMDDPTLRASPPRWQEDPMGV